MLLLYICDIYVHASLYKSIMGGVMFAVWCSVLWFAIEATPLRIDRGVAALSTRLVG